MKNFLKVSALILMISDVSFSKEKGSIADEKKATEIAKKYHLTRSQGIAPKNAKHFGTLEQMETYLKSRSKKRIAKATTNIMSKRSPKIGGSSSSHVDGSMGHYWATLEFNDFSNDWYPELLYLMWTDGASTVSSELRGIAWQYNPSYPAYLSWNYSQESSSKDTNTMNIAGEYVETYWSGQNSFSITCDVEITASFDATSISATLYIQDR